jgi:hypothetical protein
MKWSFPHFDYRGEMMCSMAAFKAHCSFGFWKGPLLPGASGVTTGAMGDFGKITAIADLPSKARLTALIKQAMKLNETGVKRAVRTPPPKAPVRVPTDLAAALRGNAAAAAAFKEFSPSARREYAEWVAEAKQAATRARRIVTAVGGSPRETPELEVRVALTHASSRRDLRAG